MGKRTNLILLLLLVSTVFCLGANNNRFTLVIDAGHGGHDAGAVGAVSKEKNINLKVALAFGKYVERNCPDVKVVYTRKTDVFIPLNERANIANRNKADLFISIHANALPKGKIARGVETYTLGIARAKENLEVAKRENSVILVERNYKEVYGGFDPDSPESYIVFELMQDKNMAQSVELAREVQNCVCRSTGQANKGVHQAGFLVLRETSMPSCLIELGFITTPDEERFMNSTSGVDRLARGIYNAFAAYKNKYDKKITVPYEPEDNTKVEVPTIVPDNKAADNAKRSKKPVITPEPDNAEEPADSVRAESVEKKTDVVEDGAETAGVPVFKVQILAASGNQQPSAKQLKGLENTECYQENGMSKYTYGSSEDYNEIYRLRKSILDKFPQAFIVAFKNGRKVDVNEAIREFKANKNKTR